MASPGSILFLMPSRPAISKCREAQVRVGGWVRETCLDALCFRAFCPWDTNTTRAVTRGIRAQNRSLKARDQTLVAVCGRVGEGVQRFGVLQDTADEIQRFLGQVGIFVACEQRLAVFPDRHVDVHTGAVVTVDRLWHECRRFAVSVRHVVDHILVFLKLVGLLCEAVKDQAKLVLARGNFVVMLVDLHTEALHRGEHFRTRGLALRRLG